MTIERLYELCRREIEDGNGDREIVLCVQDDKLNDEFHLLKDGFSSPAYQNFNFNDCLTAMGIDEDELGNMIVLN